MTDNQRGLKIVMGKMLTVRQRQILGILNSQKERISGREIAEYLGVTYRHLLYVISDFVKQGILRKTAQGYQILRPDQLRLLSTDRMS